MAHHQRVRIHILPTTWLGRLLATAVAALLLVLAFFFLTFVLVAVGVMILVALVRLLLPTHKTHGQTPGGVIEGEYSIESEEHKPVASAMQFTKEQ